MKYTADFKEKSGNTRGNNGAMTANLLFGILALIFAMASATFVSVMCLTGLSFVSSGKGLAYMLVCLICAYVSSAPAIIFGVISRKLGMVSALNKTAVALGVACCFAGTFIFTTLLLIVAVSNAGIIL